MRVWLILVLLLGGEVPGALANPSGVFHEHCESPSKHMDELVRTLMHNENDLMHVHSALKGPKKLFGDVNQDLEELTSSQQLAVGALAGGVVGTALSMGANRYYSSNPSVTTRTTRTIPNHGAQSPAATHVNSRAVVRRAVGKAPEEILMNNPKAGFAPMEKLVATLIPIVSSLAFHVINLARIKGPCVCAGMCKGPEDNDHELCQSCQLFSNYMNDAMMKLLGMTEASGEPLVIMQFVHDNLNKEISGREGKKGAIAACHHSRLMRDTLKCQLNPACRAENDRRIEAAQGKGLSTFQIPDDLLPPGATELDEFEGEGGHVVQDDELAAAEKKQREGQEKTASRLDRVVAMCDSGVIQGRVGCLGGGLSMDLITNTIDLFIPSPALDELARHVLVEYAGFGAASVNVNDVIEALDKAISLFDVTEEYVTVRRAFNELICTHAQMSFIMCPLTQPGFLVVSKDRVKGSYMRPFYRQIEDAFRLARKEMIDLGEAAWDTVPADYRTRTSLMRRDLEMNAFECFFGYIWSGEAETQEQQDLRDLEWWFISPDIVGITKKVGLKIWHILEDSTPCLLAAKWIRKGIKFINQVYDEIFAWVKAYQFNDVWEGIVETICLIVDVALNNLVGILIEELCNMLSNIMLVIEIILHSVSFSQNYESWGTMQARSERAQHDMEMGQYNHDRYTSMSPSPAVDQAGQTLKEQFRTFGSPFAPTFFQQQYVQSYSAYPPFGAAYSSGNPYGQPAYVQYQAVLPPPQAIPWQVVGVHNPPVYSR